MRSEERGICPTATSTMNELFPWPDALCMHETAMTSGLKSDVIVVFLDPDFPEDAKISAIRVHLRTIWDYLIFAWVFRTSWPKMFFLGRGAKRERRSAILTPNELDFTFEGSYVCANFGDNRSINATVRVLTDGHTDRHTDRRKPILYVPSLPCYIAMRQIEICWSTSL